MYAALSRGASFGRVAMTSRICCSKKPVMVAKQLNQAKQHRSFASSSSSSSTSSSPSRGALAGGFSRENLAAWAQREWGEMNQVDSEKEPDHYVDLFSAEISGQCATMLEQHPHPASALARAMFQSNQFAMERLLLSIFMASDKGKVLPEVFKQKSVYLMFHVSEVTPHEIIFKWSATGCTMLAVNPRVRKVYLGSGIKSSTFLDGMLFQKILAPLHIRYSKFLVQGIVTQLEHQAKGL